MLETIGTLDPVRGYRLARVEKIKDQFVLEGIAFRIPFLLEDEAQCALAVPGKPWHTPPDDDCKCGFYSIADRRRIQHVTHWGQYGYVLLHCDYFGVIFEHVETFQEGKRPITIYRGQYQRVLAMEHPICAPCCANDGEMEPATRWAVEPGTTAATPACFGHAAGGAIKRGWDTWPLVLPGWERMEILPFSQLEKP